MLIKAENTAAIIVDVQEKLMPAMSVSYTHLTLPTKA